MVYQEGIWLLLTGQHLVDQGIFFLKCNHGLWTLSLSWKLQITQLNKMDVFWIPL